VERRLGWRRLVTFDDFSIQVHDQQVVGAESKPARIARLNEDAVGTRYTGAHMSAVIHNLGHNQQARARGDLLPQGVNRSVGHKNLALD
jgi:hypothetical protein